MDVDAAGQFVVAWDGAGINDTNGGIFAQRFDASGNTLGANFRVNTYTTGTQSTASVAVAPTGEFVVVWQGFAQPGGHQDDIYAQRFDASGTALSGEFRVNAFTTGAQRNASATLDATGSLIVAWESDGQDGQMLGVFARRFDNAGNALSGDFQVNTYTPGTQTRPVVAVDASGDFIVAYQSHYQDASDYGIYARRYDSAGTALGSEFLVNTTTTGKQMLPSIAFATGGEFVVAWQNGEPTTTGDIYFQRYSAAGAPVGSETLANVWTTSGQADPSVAIDGAGNIVLAWQSSGQDGSGTGVYVRRFDSSGNFLSPEFRAHSVTADAQQWPAVAATASGRAWVVFNAWQPGGSSAYDVVLRAFDEAGANNPPVASAGGPYSIVQGSTLQLNASASSDPDTPTAPILSYAWDVNNDGVFGDVIGANPALTWAQLQLFGFSSVETRTIAVQVTDPFGLVSTAQATVSVTANTPPVASAGGPYSVVQGSSVTLSAAGSSDPDLGQSLTYAWDINNDGVYGDRTGISPSVSWATLTSLGVGPDPGTVQIRVRITDTYGAATDSSPTTLTIVANNSPIAKANGPYLIVAGGNLSLSATGSSDPDGQSITYAWDVNDDGVFGDATGSSPTLTAAQLTALGIGSVDTCNVRVRVQDSFGAATVSNPTVLVVVSSGPAVLAGNPYFLTEGQSISITGVATGSGTFSVDVNGDGIFTDDGTSTSPSFTLPWSQLVGLGIVDGPSTHSVRMRYTNGSGQTVDSPVVLLSVTNAEPTAQLIPSVIGGAQQNVPLAFSLVATDPSAIDQAANFTFSIDWDGNGTIDETVVGPSGSSVFHAFDTVGLVTVRVTATDKDGGTSAADSVTLLVGPESFTSQGTETRVNNYTIGSQQSPSIARDVAGNYIVVWESPAQDGSSAGIYGQRFTASGVAVGSEFRVNSYTTNAQSSPSVAMSPGGDFVVVWSGAGAGDTAGVFGQRYDSLGNPLGTEFQVNTYTTNAQSGASVAIDASGDFVVVWESSGQDGSSSGIYAKRFDSSGTPVGGEFRVNTTTTSNEIEAAVAMDAAGNFVVVWRGAISGSSNASIQSQRFASNGTPIGSEMRVNTTTTTYMYDPSVSMNASGDYVVVWEYNGSASQDIVALRFNAAGVAQGGEFLVNEYTSDWQTDPVVSMADSGEFVIAWTSYDQDGAADGVYAQRFHSSGIPLGVEFRANTTTGGSQNSPSVVISPTGNFVIAWDSGEIHTQRYGSFINSPPTSQPGGPYSLVQGSTLSLAGSGTDPDPGQSLVFSWDLNDDGIFGDVTGAAPSVTWAQITALGIGATIETRNIHLRVQDSFGGSDDSTTTLTILGGTAPTASAGGPYAILEGDSLFLFGAGSDADPGQTALLSYAWDANGDGVFGDATGSSVTLTWAQLGSLGIGAPDSRSVRLRVTDPVGLAGISSVTTLTVQLNTPPSATAGGPYSIVEGTALSLSAMGSSDPEGRSVSHSWDINNDGVFGDALGVTPTLTWSQLVALGITGAPDVRDVRVRVFDGFHTTTSSPASLNVTANTPPTANSGGPYSITEGAALVLNGTGSSDPDAGQTLTYSWDVNGDGNFGDATGANPTLSLAQLAALGLGDGTNVWNLALRVTDSFGASSTDTKTLNISNVPPTASITGPSTAIIGNARTYTLTATDASAIDQSAPFTFDIDWNGDGSVDETVAGLSGMTVSHTFNTVGDFVVGVRATDKDGGTGAAGSLLVSVNEANGTTGPYVVGEGQSLALEGWSDIDSGDASTTFSWDVNGDGVFGDAVGRSATLTWSQLQALGISDGPTSRSVVLRVTNSLTSQTIDLATTLTLQNVAPTAVSITGPATGNLGQSVTFTVTATDPSPADQSGNFTFLLDYNNDGAMDQTVTGPSGHTFSTNWVWGVGPQTIKVYARDKDFGTSTAFGTHTINIAYSSSVTEGGSLTLNANSIVSLPPPYSMSFPRWDVNNDGVYDASGTSASFSWATLESLGIGDGLSTRTGRLQYYVYDPNHPTTVPSPSHVNFTFAVINANPTAAAISGPSLATPGVERLFTLTAADHSSSDQIIGFTFAIDWNGDMVTDEVVTGPSGTQVTHTFATAGTYQVRMTASDKDGGTRTATPISVSVAANAISAGGPYTIAEGQSLVLSGATSIDGDDGNTSYTWDVNGDAVFGDAVGRNATLTWAQLQSLGIDDGALSRTMTLQVHHSLTSQTLTSSTTLTVTNASPVVSVIGPSGGVVGQTISLVLNAADPSVTDQSAGFIFRVDWENDGVYEETFVGASGLVVTHAYASAGSKIARITATDKDGTISTSQTKGFTIQTNVITFTEGQSQNLPGNTYAGYYGSPSSILNPTWDLNGDGIFGDRTGSAPFVTWDQLLGLGIDDGPATYDWAFRFDKDSQTIQFEGVLNITNAPPVAVLGTPYAIVNQPRLVTLLANDASPVDQSANFTFEIDWNNDLTIDETVVGPSGMTVLHTFTTAGANVVRVLATDKDGLTSAALSATVNVEVGGTTAGAPYSIAENAASLIVSGISDIDTGDGNTTYTWDLNDDGIFGDAVGDYAVISAAQLTSLGLADGPATFDITMQATDALTSQTAFATSTITVSNVSPTAGITGPSTGEVGQVLTFTLTVADGSPSDQAANFTWVIDWDGNGSNDQTVVGPSGTAVNHVYTTPVNNSIRVRATDKDGGVSANHYSGIVITGTDAPSGSGILEGNSVTLYGFYGYDPFSGPIVGDWSVAGLYFPDQLNLTLSWNTFKQMGLDDGPSATVTATYTTYTYVGLGQYAPQTSNYLLTIANKAPSASIVGPSSSTVGLPVGFTLSANDASDVDDAAGFSFAIDWNGDGTFDETVVGLSGTKVWHTFDAEGSFNVRMNATDKDGGVSSIDNEFISIGPLVDSAGNPYTISEGDSLALAGTSIHDGDANTVYEWDVNGDGIFTDATGRVASLTWAQLEALGINDQASGLAVSLRVTNTTESYSNIVSTTLTVVNSAPIASISGPDTDNRYLLYASDPSSVDQAASFTFQIDWNGDGTVDESVVGPSGTTVAHVMGGPATILVRAQDKDMSTGPTSSYTPTSGPGNIQPQGTEFRVNSVTSNNQENPAIAVDSAGNFVVVWNGRGSGVGTNNSGIFAQRYSSAGVKLGPEILVTAGWSDSLYAPAVAVDSSGNFVVTWETSGSGETTEDVYARLYHSDGIALGQAFQVNTFTAGTQNQSAVAMDPDGDFVIVWSDTGRDPVQRGIYARRYSSDGTAQGTEFLVNTPTVGVRYNPSIAMNVSGAFVVAWDDTSDVFGRRFDASGAALGAQFIASNYTTGVQGNASTAIDSGGDFVIAWHGAGATDTLGIFARRYSAGGSALGNDFRVNTATTGNQQRPGVAIDADGNLIFTWDGNGAGDTEGIFARRYLAGGAADGGEFRVNTYTSHSQRFPVVATQPSGNFVILWESSSQDGSSDGVYGQRFVVNQAPIAVAGGPYSVTEGNALTTSAAGSADPDGQPLQYFWDINGDGDYSDAVGESPTLNWSTLRALGLDGPASLSAGVWIVDSENGFAVSPPVTLDVLNAPPSASIAESEAPLLNQGTTFILSALDPSLTDELAGFTFDLDWDGNGTFDETVSGASGVSVEHTFAAVGVHSVKVRATDKDGGQSSIFTLAVTVSDWELVGGDLVWRGSDGADSIVFEEVGPGQVRMRTLSLAGAASTDVRVIAGVTGSVIAHGGKGADRLDASGLTRTTQLWGELAADTILGGQAADTIYGDADGGEGSADSIVGGDGNDTIYGDGSEGSAADAGDTILGGAGDDVIDGDGAEGSPDSILGGQGNDSINTGGGSDFADGGSEDDIVLGGDGAEGFADTLIGGDGRDILIGDGGTDVNTKVDGGSDRLEGGLGDDIILAGYFLAPDDLALGLIHQEWTSSRSYEERIANISGTGVGPRANADSFWVLGVNTYNDRKAADPPTTTLVDEVLAGGDRDWLLLDSAHDTADEAFDEMVTDLAAYSL